MLTLDNQIMQDCKDYIIDHLGDLEGYEHNLFDLGFDITQDDNCSGSVLYNTYDTVQYLAENYFNVSEIIDELGDDLIDTSIFFSNPETFHVQLLVTTAEYICGLIDFTDRIEELLNSNSDEDQELADTLQSLADGDTIKFTTEIIDELKSAIENLELWGDLFWNFTQKSS